MALEENGTKFTERIEIDEEEDVEVFRVPAHNNVEGADFYHDFKEVRFEGFIQGSSMIVLSRTISYLFFFNFYIPYFRLTLLDSKTLKQNIKYSSLVLAQHYY